MELSVASVLRPGMAPGVLALLLSAGVAGTLAGRLVLNRIVDCRFLLILDAILLVLALRLIWAGAIELAA